MSTKIPFIICGEEFQDERGGVAFFNHLDMRPVRRMYVIAPLSPEIIRAWQGHRIESKWFFCISGAFEIKLIEIDDFHNPAPLLPIKNFTLSADKPQVLYVPGGFASGIKAISSDSKLMIYSDFTLEESSKDDFRYTVDTWNVWEK